MHEEHFLKTYRNQEHPYLHTTLVRHKGTVVAFAMDANRRIRYTVLDLDDRGEKKSEIDADYWHATPIPLSFPDELARAGFAAVGNTRMPVVKKGTEKETDEPLPAEERDGFRSSTARLTALAPLHALSDGKHIYLFRQSIAKDHGDALFVRADGRATGNSDLAWKDGDQKSVPIIDNTLLVDRFILAGSRLHPPMEVRYRRSRKKDQPLGKNDTLGTQDMDGAQFREPSLELGFIRHLEDGRFAVLLVPTQQADTKRWQIFACNALTKRIDSFSVQRSEDGLFDTQGSQTYTSPDPRFQSAVLERSPGKCPFTGQDLIPIIRQSGFGGSALRLDGQATIEFPIKAWAEEAILALPTIRKKLRWLYWGLRFGGSTRSTTKKQYEKYRSGFERYVTTAEQAQLLLWARRLRTVGSRERLRRVGGPYQAFQAELWCKPQGARPEVVPEQVPWGHWMHLVVAHDGVLNDNTAFINGRPVPLEAAAAIVGMDSPLPDPGGVAKLVIGGSGGVEVEIDEVRLWNRARDLDSVPSDRHQRLVGNEPGLIGYWRFDEGSGNAVGDQSDHRSDGEIKGTATWVQSDAPVGPHPGIHRSSLGIDGRLPDGGMSALLYYQQEMIQAGHSEAPGHIKQNARVMLAVTTKASAAADDGSIAILDSGVSRDGTLAQLRGRVTLPVIQENPQVRQNLENQEMAEAEQRQRETARRENADRIIELEKEMPKLRWLLADAKFQELMSRGATFFDGAQYDGKFIRLKFWETYIGELSGRTDNGKSENWNDEISSVRVDPGVVATAWRHENQGGWKVTFQQGDHPKAWWSNQFSTIQITYTAEWKKQYKECIETLKELGKLSEAVKSWLQSKHSDESSEELVQRLAARRSELEACRHKRVTLAREAKKASAIQFGENALPMPLLHTDPSGLTVAGGLLKFASAQGAPSLFDGAAGRVALYFRGKADEFFAAYFDPHCQRSRQGISLDDGSKIAAVARAVESNPILQISVEPQEESRCRVIIKDADSKIEERWQHVPRRADLFAGVLNGKAAETTLVGRVALLEEGTATLVDPLSMNLPQRCTVQIGTRRFKVGSLANKGADTISMAAADELPAVAPTPRKIGTLRQVDMPYDSLPLAAEESIAYVVPIGAALQVGSTQFTVRQTVGLGEKAIPVQPVFGIAPESLSGQRIDALPYDGVSDRRVGTVDELAGASPGQFARLYFEEPEAAKGVHHPVIKGTVLRIGEALFKAEEVSASPAGPVRVRLLGGGTIGELEKGAEVEQFEPVPISLVPYDYASDARVEPHGADLSRGSLLVKVATPDNQALVLPEASPLLAAALPHWVGDAPGRALHLDGTKSYACREKIEGLEDALRHGNLTMEAWIKPTGVSPSQPAIVMNHGSASHSFQLSLLHESVEDYRVKASVGYQVDSAPTELNFTAKTALSHRSWHHIAAVYQQAYGLQFDGKDGHLSVPHSSELDLNHDLTIEVFFQFSAGFGECGLLAKGQLKSGGGGNVPYALSIDSSAAPIFEFEDEKHGTHRYECTEKLTSDQFYKLAVARQRQSKTETKTVKQVIGGKPIDVPEKVDIHHWDLITFYLDGRQIGDHFKYEGPDPGRTEERLEIGRIRRGQQTLAHKGLISEVRLWSRALPAKEPAQGLGTKLTGREQGLAAWWACQENTGTATRDAKGGHDARLKGGVKWVNSPDVTPETGSTLLIYQDGSSVAGELGHDNAIKRQDLPLSLGTNFEGLLEEARVWRTARTQEQILDNMFGRLKGERHDLIACYSFGPILDEQGNVRDEKHLIHDGGLLGIDLDAAGVQNLYDISDAPISADAPEVRSALARVTTDFQGRISSTPSAQEYGDLQNDGQGNLQGVLKRCYAYVQDGDWHLLTGHKVGSLITEWIGQAQFDPQIMGFVEGAPPVPSENLTAGPKNPKTTSYDNASSIDVVQAEDVNYSCSKSRQDGLDAEFEAGLAYETKVKITEVMAPYGFGIGKQDKLAYKNEGKAKFESSHGWSATGHVGNGRNTNEDLKVALRGHWEEPGHLLNQSLGQRYQPSNVGMALVRSETADIFALRMAHNRTLVALRFLPNPDIPKDVNLIPFPINPRYTKQGTLDGGIGYDERGKVLDPDYANAHGYGEYSYFKPREAYALKKSIEREEQRVRAYYSSQGPDTSGKKEAFGFGAAGGAFAPLIGTALLGGGSVVGGAALSMAAAGSITGGVIQALGNEGELASGFTQQNLANTYVWTANGGFYAESTGVTHIHQETVAGSFEFKGKAGGGMGYKIEGGGTESDFTMSGMMGGHFTITKSRSEASKESFNLNVSLDLPGDLQRYDQIGVRSYDRHGNPVLVPGKVDCYRFMTFYLASSGANHEDLFSKVIDPIWLEESDDPNAVALRNARSPGKKPPCWRVFHRVTFASRILPEFPGETAPPIEKVMKAVNVRSNWELLQKLEPFVKNRTDDHLTFAKAVRSALETSLPELVPHSHEVIEMAAVYFEVGGSA